MIPKLAVVGLGLIGGSLARAARTSRAAARIAGFDVDVRQRQLALELGVVDEAAASAAEAVAGADVVVLAVPVLHTAEALRACRSGLADGAVVTDVGSTKQSVLADVTRACAGVLPPWFVAGHPIAGTEKSGVANAVPGLFHGRRVILTPHRDQDRAALARVASLWQACGARVVEMDPARHDSIFAATSHLPHLLAYAFVDMLSRLDGSGDLFANAGGGFRDFTRIASSSPEMWHDIVRANADSVGALLERQIGELGALLALIRGGRWPELQATFERARAARERWLAQIE
ncbi:MAG TPA: prephenate dehydrogenase/arogenate dehydrogenase family protein [Candidatus Binatia bacterium]|nr:prephenate dehydrogenase/arogenate dehydrogenase family protein [Candidatus Binatia bacterium]